jgi:NADH-quinone oxidoreductase subunit N
VIGMLFADAPPARPRERILHPYFYGATYASLVVLVLLLFWMGVFPGVVLQFIKDFLLIG